MRSQIVDAVGRPDAARALVTHERDDSSRRQSFESVLVAVVGGLDHATSGLQRAMGVAGDVGDRVTVHRTVHPSAGIRMRRMWNRPHNRQAATDQLVAATTERLGRLVDATEPTRSFEVIVEVGRWPEALVSTVRNGGHDLVIVSVDGGRHTISQIRRLLRVCPCALLVVSGELEPGPVVAAIDLGDGDAFNRSILRTASVFAAVNDEAVHVTHALGTRTRDTSVDHTGPTPIDRSTDDADRRLEASRDLSRLVASSARPDATAFHVGSGDPVEVATNTAVQVDATLIVVGSTGRVGAKQRLTGTTVERLLASRRQSVLIVHPSGTSISGALRRSGTGRTRRTSPPPRS